MTRDDESPSLSCRFILGYSVKGLVTSFGDGIAKCLSLNGGPFPRPVGSTVILLVRHQIVIWISYIPNENCCGISTSG